MKETNIWPQVITKIGKILDFGLEYGKQFGKWAAGFTAFNWKPLYLEAGASNEKILLYCRFKLSSSPRIALLIAGYQGPFFEFDKDSHQVIVRLLCSAFVCLQCIS